MTSICYWRVAEAGSLTMKHLAGRGGEGGGGGGGGGPWDPCWVSGTLDCTLRENSRLRVSRNMGALWGSRSHCCFFFSFMWIAGCHSALTSMEHRYSCSDKEHILWGLTAGL